MQEYIFVFFGVVSIIIVALLFWFFTEIITLLKYTNILLEEIAFDKDVEKIEKTFTKLTTPEDKQKIIMNGWGI